MNIGFIGIGLMGTPMALRLVAAGHELRVHSRRRDSAATVLDAGASWADTPAGLADCDVVFTMLPKGEDVEAVLFGDEGLFSGDRGPGLVVDSSTVGPAWARRIAERLAEHGAALVDAPVSGGPAGAESGRLAIMAGGAPADFARVAPLLELLGSPRLLGPVGAGQATKLVNQLLLAGAMAGIADAFALASRSGLPLDAVREAVGGGMAGGALLEWAWPRLVAGDSSPGFKISHFLKDLDLAGVAGRELGLALELTGTVREAYRSIAGVAGDRGTQAIAGVELGSITKETE